VRVRALLGALSLTAFVAACSSTASSGGPLGDGGVPGIQCMRFGQGRPVTTGIYDLTDHGTSPVTIKSVTLPGAHGLTMTKPWLAPIHYNPKNGDYVDVGVGAPYPPSTSETPQWAQRRPAIGGIIGASKTLTLVFGLTRTTAKAGKSSGPVIAYTAGGTSYTVKERVSLIVAADCTTQP
jgi:hypothetical protein